MEKKSIQVVLLKPLAADTPKDKKAKSSKTPPPASEAGGRAVYYEYVECPNGHVFYTWADTDYWRTVECPYDGTVWQI